MVSPIITLAEHPSKHSVLPTAPDEKKILIASKLGGPLEGMLKVIFSFNGMIEKFNATIHPEVQSQIKAIDARTEKAANDIIDANSDMTLALKGIPEANAKAIQKQINRIYEACNFQDLVSQHANEIRLVMNELAEDMTYFKKAISKPNAIDHKSFAEHEADKKKRSDSHLLNGPTTQLKS